MISSYFIISRKKTKIEKGFECKTAEGGGAIIVENIGVVGKEEFVKETNQKKMC